VAQRSGDNPAFCSKYQIHKAAVYRAGLKFIYGKKHEKNWRAAAFWANLVGLAPTGIPGVDLLTGYVTGAIAAGYDCNYRHRLACIVDVVGMFTGRIGATWMRVPKILSGLSNLKDNVTRDSSHRRR